MSFGDNHHRRVLPWPDHRNLATAVETTLPGVGTMWYRIEGNAEPCPCGDVAEKWILLAGAKPLIRASVCRTCNPLLADMVTPPPSLVPQRENAEDTDDDEMVS